jgi:chorismate synthase
MAPKDAPLSYHIRPFETPEEYRECAEFQEEVWGQGFNERVSAAILLVANKIGGLAAGAYDDGGLLLGFVFGLTGVKDGALVHWSDMLAVREGYRDRGLGRALKAYQREVLLGRGVRRMHWTFDPLQSRNAYVNFARLGIVSHEYVRDMYGDTGSPLHRVGTDRLIATWEMDSERVARRLAGDERPPTMATLAGKPAPAGAGVNGMPGGGHPPEALRALEDAGLPRPGAPELDLDAPSILVAIPRELDDLMAEAPDLAREWRGATRPVFETYMARGYHVRELLPGEGISRYLLVKEDA